MNKSLPRWFTACVLAIGAVLVSSYLYYFFCFYYPETPGGRQARNLAIAKQHIPTVMAVLDKDKRFAEIHLYAYTGDDGCLGVTGAVYSQAAMDDLKKAVESTAPPVPVHWTVNLFEPDEQSK